MVDGNVRVRWLRVVVCGLATLLIITSAARAQVPRPSLPPQLMVEDDAGGMLTLGANGVCGALSVINPDGSGTLLFLPLSSFHDLLHQIVTAPARVSALTVTDVEQCLYATPINLRETIGGVVMVSLTRARWTGGSAPVLTLYAKRGDEVYQNRLRFSQERLRTLVHETRREFKR